MNPNVRPDMMRQSGAQPGMLNVGPPFMQGLAASGQQQLGTNHPGVPSANSNASHVMLNNTATSLSPAQQHRYEASLQRDIRQRQMQQMRHAGANQHMIGSAGSSLSSTSAPPHMAALPHNQNMLFNTNMIPQGSGNNLRRVSSQPSMNQGSVPISGMPVNAGLAMNPSVNLNQPQMRQIPPQIQHQARLQQSQQQLQNQMTPDMVMAMSRQAPNSSMPAVRSGSSQSQLMNSLSQPGSLQHHQLNMHHNQFQNPVQMPSQHQQPPIPSPRASSHAQGMSMPTAGPSQPPVNRPPTNPDESQMGYMNFPNSQFPQSHAASRMLKTNNQFPPFVPPSRSPNQLSEMSQNMSSNIVAPGSNANRPGFHLTPAQQFEQMNPASDNFSVHFPMPPTHGPPRPPSHNTSHPPLPQHSVRQSPPRPPDPHAASRSQRPSSQPQAIPQPTPGPQGHPSRSSHPLVPPGAAQISGNRMMIPQQGQPGQQMPTPSQSLPMTSRPPPGSQALQPSARKSSVPPPSISEVPTDAQTLSHSTQRMQNLPQMLGSGQGISRLLEFSGDLSNEHRRKLHLAYWDDLKLAYFSPRAVMKFTFWKDSLRAEAKVFDFGVDILPRFFLVTTQSGVKSMILALEGARERLCSPGRSIVECLDATWTYKYANGYTVVLRGPLTVQVVVQSTAKSMSLCFEDFHFDAGSHEKSIALDSILGTRLPLDSKIRLQSTPASPNPPGSSGLQAIQHSQVEEEPRIAIEGASIPVEPVNAFGIPQATMRCLELADSVAQMGELMTFSKENFLGPKDALGKFAAWLREHQVLYPLPPIPGTNNFVNGLHPGLGNPASSSFNPKLSSNQSVTLYSSAPPSVTNLPAINPVTNSTLLENASLSACDSSQKQHKTISTHQQQQPPPLPSQHSQPAAQPQTTPSSSGTVSTSPTISSGSGATTNTPALPNATLKRKQATDSSSPAATVNEPPQKRPTRKRRATNPGGNPG